MLLSQGALESSSLFPCAEDIPAAVGRVDGRYRASGGVSAGKFPRGVIFTSAANLSPATSSKGRLHGKAAVSRVLAGARLRCRGVLVGARLLCRVVLAEAASRTRTALNWVTTRARANRPSVKSWDETLVQTEMTERHGRRIPCIGGRTWRREKEAERQPTVAVARSSHGTRESEVSQSGLQYHLSRGGAQRSR